MNLFLSERNLRSSHEKRKIFFQSLFDFMTQSRCHNNDDYVLMSCDLILKSSDFVENPNDMKLVLDNFVSYFEGFPFIIDIIQWVKKVGNKKNLWRRKWIIKMYNRPVTQNTDRMKWEVIRIYDFGPCKEYPFQSMWTELEIIFFLLSFVTLTLQIDRVEA